MKPIVVPIPAWSRKILSAAPRWQETPLTSKSRIARHAHAFLALYFAFGVQDLDAAGRSRRLPPSAMVIVPPRVVHGWRGATNGGTATVGHYHPGHPAHVVEPAGAEAA